MGEISVMMIFYFPLAEHRIEFEKRRKMHYREFEAVKLARKLIEEEDDDDDETADKPAAAPETKNSDETVSEEPSTSPTDVTKKRAEQMETANEQS